jgi:hypothetical protein
MADRLTLVRALEDSGMPGPTADKVASEIYDAIHDNVATKADIAGVRADIESLEHRFATRFEQVERQIDRMVVRLGALVIVVSGALFTALHYWPPR